MAPRPHRGAERRERSFEAVPDEACAETEGGVEGARLDRECGSVALDDLDALGEAGRCDPFARGRRKLGRALDADDAAPERRRKQRGGPGLAAGHVEHAAFRAEAKPFAEQADLLRARRVLQLVVALGDGVVPGHERRLRGTSCRATASPRVGARDERCVPARRARRVRARASRPCGHFSGVG